MEAQAESLKPDKFMSSSSESCGSSLGKFSEYPFGVSMHILGWSEKFVIIEKLEEAGGCFFPLRAD